MKNKYKKTAVALITGAVLAVSIPSAFAYFTDYKQAEGKYPIVFVPEPESEEFYDNKQKKLVITNSDEATEACWVRAKYYATSKYVLPEGTIAPEQKIDSNYWTYNAEDGWYYYKDFLNPGESTKFDTFNIGVNTTAPNPEDIENALDEFNIIMVYESTPVLYKGTPGDEQPYADWSIEYIQRGGE